MARYYIMHFEPIDDIYMPHYAEVIKTEREMDSPWRTEINIDDDYTDVAEDWMYYADDILEYGEILGNDKDEVTQEEWLTSPFAAPHITTSY